MTTKVEELARAMAAHEGLDPDEPVIRSLNANGPPILEHVYAQYWRPPHESQTQPAWTMFRRTAEVAVKVREELADAG